MGSPLRPNAAARLPATMVALVLAAFSHSHGQDLSPEQLDRIEQLEALGYLAATSMAPEATGVVAHDAARAYDALNLYVSAHAPEAFLMDMGGRILHKWAQNPRESWPDFERSHKYGESWRRAKLFENGDLLAITDGWGVVKLDRDSNLIWTYSAGAHHDLFVVEETGEIFVLTRKGLIYPKVNETEPVLDDFVVVLDSEGQELKRISILDAIAKSSYASLFDEMHESGDVLHTNTIEVLDGRLAAKVPAFKKGNILLSCREIDTVCVLDPNTERIVWAMSSPWHRQHQPTVLDDGNVLVFDNKGIFPYSRIVQFDPATKESRVVYAGDASNRFYSAGGGAAQRLPNGNTLATLTTVGRAVELTPDGAAVWRFVNPHKYGPAYAPAQLFDVIRLPRDFPLGWLGGAEDWRLREPEREEIEPPSPGRTVRRWDFEGWFPAGGWRRSSGAAKISFHDGFCAIDSENNSGGLRLRRANIDTAQVNRLTIRMRSDRGTHGLVFWGRRPGDRSRERPFSYAERVTHFLIEPDGAFHEYTVALNETSQDWSGEWTDLNVHPAVFDVHAEDELVATVEVDWIELGFDGPTRLWLQDEPGRVAPIGYIAGFVGLILIVGVALFVSKKGIPNFRNAEDRIE